MAYDVAYESGCDEFFLVLARANVWLTNGRVLKMATTQFKYIAQPSIYYRLVFIAQFAFCISVISTCIYIHALISLGLLFSPCRCDELNWFSSNFSSFRYISIFHIFYSLFFNQHDSILCERVCIVWTRVVKGRLKNCEWVRLLMWITYIASYRAPFYYPFKLKEIRCGVVQWQ